jgi:hypothetical protein
MKLVILSISGLACLLIIYIQNVQQYRPKAMGPNKTKYCGPKVQLEVYDEWCIGKYIYDDGDCAFYRVIYIFYKNASLCQIAYYSG